MSSDPTGRERSALYEFAAAALKSRGPLSVLDVACGSGEGTAEIARQLPEARVAGVDLDPALVASARSRFARPGLSFETADARKMPFASGNFEAVVSFHTVEHFIEEDQERFLKELQRLLKPGGMLLMATPDREVWALQGIAGQQPDHLREVNQVEFVGLVRQAGFRIAGLFGQSILRSGSFPLRRLLNFLKRLDLLRLRKLFGRTLQAIDQKTQPIHADCVVRPLHSGTRASVTVIVAEK